MGKTLDRVESFGNAPNHPRCKIGPKSSKCPPVVNTSWRSRKRVRCIIGSMRRLNHKKKKKTVPRKEI